jgi:hypothetical protein
MGVVELTLGCLAIATLFLAGTGRRRTFDDLTVAGVLLFGWTLSAMLRQAGRDQVFTREFILLANPVMDLATGLVVATFFKRRPEKWKAGLLLLLMAQIISHGAFATSDKSFAARYIYVLWLNVSFVAQLACAGSRGAKDLTSAFVSRMRRRALARTSR